MGQQVRAISIRGLVRKFGELTAVDRLEMEIDRGKVFAFLGPNGAGKTTTVRMLSCVLRPTEGTASVAGYDIVAQPEMVRQRVGLLTETPGLYERLTLEEYLGFFGQLHGLSAATCSRRTGELASMLGLEGETRRMLGSFSQGMRQKVALARVLLHEPEVLFLDEPTSGLDPESASVVRDHIVQLKREGGRTIVLCTHNLDEAEKLADEVAIINRGRIVTEGPMEVLRQDDGAQRFVVNLLEPAPPGLLEVAASVEGIFLARVSGGRLLEFSTRRPEATNPVLVARLVAAGAKVVSIVGQRRSLEEIYMRAIRGGGAG